MIGWFHHWVFVDFWVPVWPNIAAAIVMSTFIVRKTRGYLAAHHESLKQLVEHEFKRRS